MEHYTPPSDPGQVPDTQVQPYNAPILSSLQSSEIHESEGQSPNPSYSPYQAYSPPYSPPFRPPPGQQPYQQEKSPYQLPQSPSEAPEVVPNSFGLYQPQEHHGHRRTLSPALSQGSTHVGPSTIESPYLGSTYGHNEKEVSHSHVQPAPTQQEKKRICGLSRLVFWVLLTLLLLILAGVGVGLGVAFGRKKGTKSSAIDPQYYSKEGAFNGSGIAFAGLQGDSSVRVYFQHWTGSLRYMQMDISSGDWIGGRQTEQIVTDAKNSTPISVVAYVLGSVAKRHIFYIDTSGYVRQRTNTNTTNIWQEGPLNSLNLKALDADSVGLQACWYGNYYGDSDYAKSSTSSSSDSVADYGMHLWYASDNTTFTQYGFREGDSGWANQKTWAGFNGHSGVGCYSWGGGTTTYAMMVNLHNTVEVWWKDTNSSSASIDAHPINSWVNASKAAIPDVHPSTSLGYTDFFYAQKSDHHIQGFNITWAAENTTIVAQDTFTVGDTSGTVAGLPGTHMTVSAVDTKSGGRALYIFYQTEGTDITLFTRDTAGGQQTMGQLNIPAE
ncbi:hypothetical protein FKW77_003394 [Venturia effusa]|uniref:Fucose-specific lectin n=1 Tax=Venturia effusa TaxID=50376 RepID=A0A517L720_9PEZI|nr:hypothetical protein FKW77_003394 [Venturia effusa]